MIAMDTERKERTKKEKCNVAFHSSTKCINARIFKSNVLFYKKKYTKKTKRSQWEDVRERYSIVWINTYFSVASEINGKRYNADTLLVCFFFGT